MRRYALVTDDSDVMIEGDVACIICLSSWCSNMHVMTVYVYDSFVYFDS